MKQHNRLSPVPRRTDLGKTLSMGSSLDTAVGSGSPWRQSSSTSSLHTSPHSPSSTPHCDSPVPSSHHHEDGGVGGGGGGGEEVMSGVTASAQIPSVLAAAAARVSWGKRGEDIFYALQLIYMYMYTQ